jgi:hypothetical protein
MYQLQSTPMGAKPSLPMCNDKDLPVQESGEYENWLWLD